MSKLDYLRFLYKTGRLADDTKSDGETFREVVESLVALDEIRPAPHTTAPTVRLFCHSCRSWFEGPSQNRYGNGVCPDCLIAYGDSEQQTIERNRQKPPTRCTLCGAESRTFVCEQCDQRPMSQRTQPFDYRSIERLAADVWGGSVAEMYDSRADYAFCEDCGATLPALFKDDGTALGTEDCLVCEGLAAPVSGTGCYCRRCGTRKVRLSLIRKGCPICG